MNKVTWCVDPNILAVNTQPILSVLEQLDVPHMVLPWSWGQDANLWPNLEGPVVAYGTLPYVKKIKEMPWIPGVYLKEQHLSCAGSWHHLEGLSGQVGSKICLNEDHILLTWGMFKNHPERWFDRFQTERIFMRPSSSLKTFASLVVSQEDIHQEIQALQQISSVTNDTLICLAPSQTLGQEYRLTIVHGQVITGTRAPYEESYPDPETIPQDVWALAHHVVQHTWQPDLAYICDVVVTPKGPRVVELNSMSSSGWYGLDLSKLIPALNHIAQAEWEGDLAYGDPVPRIPLHQNSAPPRPF